MATTNPATPGPAAQPDDTETVVLARPQGPSGAAPVDGQTPDDTLPDDVRAPRGRRRTWIAAAGLAAALVAVLVLAVIVPAQQRQARIDRLTALAAQDAETLEAASRAAQAAATAGQSAAVASRRYLDEVALPATEVVLALAPLASPDAVATLESQVDAVAASQDWEPVPGDPRLGEGFDAPDLATALAERYVAADGEAEVPAEEVRQEVERLESLVDDLSARDAERVDLVTQFEAAFDATVASLPAAVATVESEAPRADAESLDALRAAAAGLGEDAALAGSAVEGAALEELLDGALLRLPAVVEKVDAFRAGVDGARASHAEVVAAEEAAAAAAARRSGSGGGGGGGGQPFCRTVSISHMGTMIFQYVCD